MTQGHLGTQLRASCFNRYQRHALAECAQSSGREFGDISDPFQVHAYGGYPGVVEHRVKVVVNLKLRVVTHGHDVAEGKRSLLKRHVDANVPALHQQRRASFGLLAAEMIRPKCNPVQVIHKAVAVGADQRHLSCRV